MRLTTLIVVCFAVITMYIVPNTNAGVLPNALNPVCQACITSVKKTAESKGGMLSLRLAKYITVVCKMAPSSFREKCSTKLEQKMTPMLDGISKKTDPKSICKKVSLCKQ